MFTLPQLIYISPEEPPNPRKRKWTEAELAQRREEAARKRKLKGAQKQEDEKVGLVNVGPHDILSYYVDSK